MAVKVLFLLAALSLFYYIIIIAYAGIRAAFSKFWLVAGIVFSAAGLLLNRGFALPDKLVSILLCCVLSGLILFAAVESRIFFGMKRSEPGQLTYIIVLGAQVKGRRVSRTLAWRLNRAAEYLKANDRTKAVLSGGQGLGEEFPEAEAMRDYLVKKGISEKRLILEKKSKNTKENLSLTGAMIGFQTEAVGIVTSNFHVYRSVRIARRAGFSKVYGIPAHSSLIMQPNNLVREFFAVLKDKAAGNL